MKSRIISLLLTLVVSACSTSPKPTYYRLSAPAAEANSSSTGIRIMIGPISLPDALDQPKIVIQESQNQVKLEDYHRWAGSLKDEIGRVLTANLAKQLNTSNIWSFSQSTQTNFDYQVIVDIQNLESTPGGSVFLDLLWTVKSSKNQRKALMGRSVVREPVESAAIAAIVASQSRSFERASADIAHALNQ